MENEKLRLEDLLERRNQYEEGTINNIAIIGTGVNGLFLFRSVFNKVD